MIITLEARRPASELTVLRLFTPRFTRDVGELRTWRMDIRHILSNNSIRDALSESGFLDIVTVGAANDHNT